MNIIVWTKPARKQQTSPVFFRAVLVHTIQYRLPYPDISGPGKSVKLWQNRQVMADGCRSLTETTVKWSVKSWKKNKKRMGLPIPKFPEPSFCPGRVMKRRNVTSLCGKRVRFLIISSNSVIEFGQYLKYLDWIRGKLSAWLNTVFKRSFLESHENDLEMAWQSGLVRFLGVNFSQDPNPF